jgi:regulatory protein
MILESLKAGSGEGVFVFCFSDHKPLTVDLSYLDLPLRELEYWYAGKDISVEEEEGLLFAASCHGAQQRALDLVHRAEQTRQGLTWKLEQKGWGSSCVKAVVSRFMALDLVSNARYARLWLQARLDRKSGRVHSPRSLLASLLGRGINHETAREALRETLNSEAEEELLTRFLEARGGEASGTEEFSFLRNRLRYEGFSAALLDRFFQ